MNIQSIDGIIKQLVNIGENTVGEAHAISNEAIQITNQFESGKLSQDGYRELMNDLATEKLELITADEMVVKQELYTIFNDIKTAISFIP